MVDLSERIVEIKKMIDDGEYFTINRARQYGKTTTIDALERALSDEYSILSLDFQKISDASFKAEEKFVKAFSRQAIKKKKKAFFPEDIIDSLQEIINRENQPAVLDELLEVFDKWCSDSEKPVVQIIDEVDTATNNQIFLDFLAQLRAGYLEQKKNPGGKTFQSVILAGITDVKHLRGKIRDASTGNGLARSLTTYRVARPAVSSVRNSAVLVPVENKESCNVHQSNFMYNGIALIIFESYTGSWSVCDYIFGR